MRKHLLLVITLLCAVVQGLWAQTSTVSYIWYSADSETHKTVIK